MSFCAGQGPLVRASTAGVPIAHLVDGPVQVDGGGVLAVHADDVSASLDKVRHAELGLHNHLPRQVSMRIISLLELAKALKDCQHFWIRMYKLNSVLGSPLNVGPGPSCAFSTLLCFHDFSSCS